MPFYINDVVIIINYILNHDSYIKNNFIEPLIYETDNLINYRAILLRHHHPGVACTRTVPFQQAL